MTKTYLPGAIVGAPNQNFVGIVTKTHNQSVRALWYSRRDDWKPARYRFWVSMADLRKPPPDVPDHIYADAMKQALLT